MNLDTLARLMLFFSFFLFLFFFFCGETAGKFGGGKGKSQGVVAGGVREGAGGWNLLFWPPNLAGRGQRPVLGGWFEKAVTRNLGSKNPFSSTWHPFSAPQQSGAQRRNQV